MSVVVPNVFGVFFDRIDQRGTPGIPLAPLYNVALSFSGKIIPSILKITTRIQAIHVNMGFS